jgi:hypothetical protein
MSWDDSDFYMGLDTQACCFVHEKLSLTFGICILSVARPSYIRPQQMEFVSLPPRFFCLFSNKTQPTRDGLAGLSCAFSDFN